MYYNTLAILIKILQYFSQFLPTVQWQIAGKELSCFFSVQGETLPEGTTYCVQLSNLLVSSKTLGSIHLPTSSTFTL